MTFSTLVKSFTTLDYHPELIRLLIQDNKPSKFIVYFMLTIVFIVLMHSFVPISYLVTWLVANNIILAFRFFIAKTIAKHFEKEPHLQPTKLLKYYITFVSFSGFIWGLMPLIAYAFAPDLYLYATLVIIIGLSTGSFISFGSVFHVYAYFFVFLVLPSFLIFLTSLNLLHIAMAVAILIYVSLVLTGSYKYFSYLKTSILLQDELTRLNNSLEGKVVESLHELQYKHYTDTNTDLPNRNRLLELLNTQTSSHFLLIDIAKFKNVNDLYGHVVADELLKEFAHYLRTLFDPKVFTLFRLSGNEFILLQIKNTPTHLEELAKYISKSTRKKDFLLSKESISLHIDIIIAIVENAKELKLSKADMTLNYAKEHKLQYLSYSKELALEEYYKNDTKWTKIIAEALQKDDVVPVFQPIISLDGSIKYESLMRLRYEDELISPYYFLDIAKKTPHYYSMTKIMIEKSFAVFSKRDNCFSINLSFKDISNDEVINFLMRKIEEYDIAKQLIVEIVESESINNFNQVQSFIYTIRELGVKIAIDDFGSGYSNFSYILELEPDFIKIDGSLIKEIDKDKKTFMIVEVISDFAKRLNIQTIAEYVHNETVYEKVKKLHIDFYQGYYFSEPLQENELDRKSLTNIID